jgi:hypothetical protein
MQPIQTKTLEVQLTDAEWYQLMQWAHESDCTLNQLCARILSNLVPENWDPAGND